MLRVAPRSQNMPANIYFGEHKNHNQKEKKYKDPLMNWPIRGLAYSNELGAALSEIAPKFGILLWFPAMLYFGADIYDKYKNKKTSYDPNAQRALEQATFQLLASVIFPTAAVITGQKIASSMGAMDKTGLTLQTQEEIVNFIQDFASRRHFGKFNGKIDTYKEQFIESFTTKRDKLIREHKIKNPLRFITDSIFTSRHPEAIAMSQKEKVLKFANENIDSMFRIYEDLTNGRRPKEFSDKMWKNFNKLKDKYAKDPDYKTTHLRDAAEDAIKKFQKSKMTKSKVLKTVGGFVALGLAIKPIDTFVEKIVIKKVVEPKLTDVFNKVDNQKFLK